MANLTIQGSIQFQSNSTKQQSCHIIAYTFVDVNGNVLFKNPNRWLKVIAIRPKNIIDIVLPGNTNPFVYNINETFNNLTDCNFVGCNVFLRVYVIPCCRTNLEPTLWAWGNDTNNPLYESADLTTTFNPPALTNIINDGYVYKDVLLNHPQYYKCDKYEVQGATLSFLQSALSGQSIKCGVSYGTTTGSIMNVNIASGILSNIIQLPNNYKICLSNAFIPTGTRFIKVTDKNGLCCNICRNYQFTSVNLPTNNDQLWIVYQNCNTGDIDSIRVQGPTTYNSPSICAVEDSMAAWLYNGTTATAYTNFTVQSGNCRNCPDLG